MAAPSYLEERTHRYSPGWDIPSLIDLMDHLGFKVRGGPPVSHLAIECSMHPGLEIQEDWWRKSAEQLATWNNRAGRVAVEHLYVICWGVEPASARLPSATIVLFVLVSEQHRPMWPFEVALERQELDFWDEIETEAGIFRAGLASRPEDSQICIF